LRRRTTDESFVAAIESDGSKDDGGEKIGKVYTIKVPVEEKAV
jgi:hypothetical protein